MMNKLFGTKEWAVRNVNIQIGCEHGCRYCYARHNAVVRFKRCTAEQWRHPQIIEAQVNRNYRKRSTSREEQQDPGVYDVLFPSSHDITPGNLPACELILKKLLTAGNRVLIVSKPHLVCIEALCESLMDWKEQIEFRFSITSSKEEVLKFWEPGASTYTERLTCLELAHRAGYKTSVAIEPVLEPEIRKILEDVRPFVSRNKTGHSDRSGGVWVGVANLLRQRMDLTGADPQEAKERMELVEVLCMPEGRAHIRRQSEGFENIIKWKNSLRKI